MKSILLVAWLATVSGLFAQNSILSGTILPLRLNGSLNSRKSKAGQLVTARLMQDVPLPSGTVIRAGSKAIGHVTEVGAAANGRGARISLVFDVLGVSKQRLPMVTNLRALGSMNEVDQAQLPKNGPGRGTSENSWTTEQIRGEVVYRGGGPVVSARGLVGIPVANGVLVRLTSRSDSKCHGDLGSDGCPQALWVFSSDACGLYGFPDLILVHAGRTAPVGQIFLALRAGAYRGEKRQRTSAAGAIEMRAFE